MNEKETILIGLNDLERTIDSSIRGSMKKSFEVALAAVESAKKKVSEDGKQNLNTQYFHGAMDAYDSIINILGNIIKQSF